MMGIRGESDPVEYRIGEGKTQAEWGFWDETWANWHGGYPTEKAARIGLATYSEELERGPVQTDEEYEGEQMRTLAIVLVTAFVVLIEIGLLRFVLPMLINLHSDAGLLGIVILVAVAIAFPWIYFVKILRPILKQKEEKSK